ncbi:hypothetical protein B0H21DRAFT_747489 [Amylocystis lapponica]|nr:hypothetical protein B0H21DRAFT_747489 [Amylocystis lapponica]
MSMSTRPLRTSHHYIRFAVSPPCADALTLRKAIQDALGQSFGLVSANTYLDVLWVSGDGTGTVVRIAQDEATRLMASVAVSLGSLKLSVLKESPFLPSLLSVDPLS